MKYLSPLIFALVLSLTWSLIHQEAAISFETHAGIQEKLAVLIRQTVLAKKPNSENFRILKIWTEPIETSKVMAHVVYSFDEPTEEKDKVISSQITADAELHKIDDDGSGLDRWSLIKMQTTNDAVVFDDGLYITPGDDKGSNNEPNLQHESNGPMGEGP